MRRWFKSGLLQFLLAIPVIAGAAPSLAEELKFGAAAGLDETEMRAELEPLLTYLPGALGRTVSLYIAKDDGDLRAQMEAGALDVGMARRGAERRSSIRCTWASSTASRPTPA